MILLDIWKPKELIKHPYLLILIFQFVMCNATRFFDDSDHTVSLIVLPVHKCTTVLLLQHTRSILFVWALNFYISPPPPPPKKIKKRKFCIQFSVIATFKFKIFCWVMDFCKRRKALQHWFEVMLTTSTQPHHLFGAKTIIGCIPWEQRLKNNFVNVCAKSKLCIYPSCHESCVTFQKAKGFLEYLDDVSCRFKYLLL